MELTTHKKYLLKQGSTVKEALSRFNILAKDAIVFIVTDDCKLVGSLTDGDVRRGLLRGFGIDNFVDEIIEPNPRFLRKGEKDITKVLEYKLNNFRIIPILDKEGRVVNVINFSELKSYLPIDVVIMAGGRGERLRPLTDEIPKPLLKVGDKPILEHNLERLSLFGIDDFWISVKYLGEKIQDYFGDGKTRNVNIQYVWEDRPMGTIGAVSRINNFQHEYILVTNSDLLTNLDFEHFFLEFLKQDADFSVVTIPYNINVPYAVLETENGMITSLKEKPIYTYFANGGIYLMKKKVLKEIPEEEFFDATNLMEKLIEKHYKVFSYPLSGYWLDVGSFQDFEKAQMDILQIKF
jgi:dTDP-glucose pyrophosphorylase